MNAVQADRHPVDRLAEEFVERYRRGERPSIADYTAKYPELAAELQEILAALVLIEEHGRAQASPSGSNGHRLPDKPAPVQLGEYRVLREIGRGGMGVVYEAVQESLGRHVALKVLPSHALLDAVRLKRFQHEAQAAARLHHTNIVPIFGVGTAEGVHFYAMQFIQGRGLDEVIDELRQLKRSDRAGNLATRNDTGGGELNSPASARTNLSSMSDTPRYYRSVGNLGAQVAEGLDHAHRQGVMHRDIKPSNLLLDAAGTVWITDFGLAKADGTEELTHSGDLVGTLRYMAPEQLRGKGDARADIYSLGSTLYELLTLRPAFDAADRAALVRQIVQDEPPRPRKVDARIPRDLETIVLKAMAHEPASRYTNASEMAADLRRFLDDKPIAARPVGVPERLWRWCVRRPALAGLAVALLVSLAVGMAGVLWQWSRAETNLKEAVRQEQIAVNMLGVAQQEQQRAEQNLKEAGRQQTIAERKAAEAEANNQTARKAVDELLTMVSENELFTQPGLQPIRLKLLTRALTFYEERLADRDQDAVARRDLALAYLRLGFIKQQLGPTGTQAADAYRQAITLLTPADPTAKEDRATTILLARAENSLGLDLINRRQRSEASATLAQARQRLERLLDRTPDDDSAQATLGMTFNNLGFLLAESSQIPRQERFEEAIEIHERALAIYRRLAPRHPEDVNIQSGLASTFSNLARRHQSLHRFDEARALQEECLEIREDLVKRWPGILELQLGVGAALNALADIIRDGSLPVQERVKLAIEHYERAMEIMEQLVRENPAVLRYRKELANIPENVSDIYASHRYDQQALEWRKREIAAWDACLALDPTNAEIRARRADRLSGQGPLEDRLGLYTEALNSRIRAREAWREIQKDPEQLAANRANIQNNLAALMLELSWHNRAAELCAAARERCELSHESPGEMMVLAYDLERPLRSIRRGPALDEPIQAQVAEYQRLAIQMYRDAMQKAPREVENFARARSHLRPYQSLVKLDASIARDPKNITALIDRSRLLLQLGDAAGSQADSDQALLLVDAALAKSPRALKFLQQRAALHFDRGDWKQVVADASVGLAHHPVDETLRRHRARASMQLGDYQQAYDDFTLILQKDPQLVSYWPERCRALVELGRANDALADANHLVDLAETHAQSADSLPWRFLVQRDAARFPEATLAIARQIAERKNTNVYRGHLGGVQFYAGQYRDAIETLEPATNGSLIARFWLAMAYQHLGEHEKAKEALTQAVRNWKGAPLKSFEDESVLRSVWGEAVALLANSPPTSE